MASPFGGFKPADPWYSGSSGPRGRSSSPETSSGEGSLISEDQFILSVGNTPSNEFPSSQAATSHNRLGGASVPLDGLLVGKQAVAVTSEIQLPDPSRPTRSKPIAIELPTVRKVKLPSKSVETPPEPLSARGDIPGGYFPLHEDPKLRVYRPHPFQLDPSKAKHRSLHRAEESTKSASHVTIMTETSRSPFAGTVGTVASSGSHTPVSSYIPSGVHDSAALPLGKYYPSNYERRLSSDPQRHPQSPDGSSVSSNPKKESQGQKYRHESAHNRTNSEVKRRLIQYQRDMVAQATMAASALLANNPSSGAYTTSPATTTLPVRGISLPGYIQKPSSPRLAPLGSPGPVTPMSLEGSGDSYLTLGRTNPSAEQHIAEFARAIRQEQGRQRHEDNRSPISERHDAISV